MSQPDDNTGVLTDLHIVISKQLLGVREVWSHQDRTHCLSHDLPLFHSVLSFDPLLQQYYDRVREVWSRPSEAMSHVTLVSISGGERDVMVPSHLSILPGAINLAVSVT